MKDNVTVRVNCPIEINERHLKEMFYHFEYAFPSFVKKVYKDLAKNELAIEIWKEPETLKGFKESFKQSKLAEGCRCIGELAIKDLKQIREMGYCDYIRCTED